MKVARVARLARARLLAQPQLALPHIGRLMGRARRRVVTKVRQIALSQRRNLVPGLVSIVVPAYNVERYIAGCLDSLVNQTYRNLEIIVIIDGATDGTAAIAEHYARQHTNIRVRRQENSGLSAARNAGVTMARGEFLCFVDSDDQVAPRAYELLVSRLETTGSDLAVARYRRFNNTRTWAAAPWIQRAHSSGRNKVTLTEYPEIMVNAVAWSKLYRRTFWDSAGLSFEVGVTYEDQAVSARAYARAKSFDILNEVLFDWRDREDGSSISQRHGEATDMAARVAAARASLSELTSAGADGAVQARAMQLLCNDFPQSIAKVPGASDDFYQTLRRLLSELVHLTPTDRWREMPAQHAAATWLILQDMREKLEDYLEARGNDMSSLECFLLDGSPAVKVPFWDDPQVNYPADSLKLSQHQLGLNASLRGARWEQDTLILDGWAYIAGIDLAEHHPTIDVSLVTGKREVQLRLEARPDKDVDRVTRHEWNDYRPGGFRAYVTPGDVEEPGAYRVRIRITAAGVTRTGWIRAYYRYGSLSHQTAHTWPDGLRLRLDPKAPGGAMLRVRRPSLALTEVDVQPSGAVQLRLRPKDSIHIRGLQIHAADHVTTLDPSAPGSPESPIFTLSRELLNGLGPGWSPLRAVKVDGKPVEVDWPNAPDDARGERIGPHVYLGRTWAGNAALCVTDGRELVVQGCQLQPDGLLLSGTGSPEYRHEWEVRLSDHRTTCVGEVVWHEQAWSALIPLESDRWRFGSRPIPLGQYTLAAHDRHGGRKLRLQAARALTARLPLIQANDVVSCRLEQIPEGPLRLTLLSPVAEDHKGPREQRLLRSMHHRGAYQIRDAVLFRTYYGELATCNALGVHTELRHRGVDFPLLWAVKDHSVVVPDGGIPVVTTSPEWYEALSTSRWVIDNMHQPEYFHKRPGQVVVATFHGYPFKNAGMRHWRQFGVSELRIRSYLRRHQQWDYLLSPAPYATPLLAEVFPGPAEMLEVGYPRNDVLFSTERDAIRQVVRSSLGIPPGANAILYAPTFRDNVTVSETQAHMVDFVDFARASRDLGPGHVILVRGHAFNRRLSERVAGGAGVIDVTDYPEISDLCLASDVAVLDYSSLRFDFALTGKPMVFLVPDLADYRDDMRGVLMPYEPTAPGPLVSSWEEAADWIRAPQRLRAQFEVDRERFRRDFTPLDDGQASARFVDRVIG